LVTSLSSETANLTTNPAIKGNYRPKIQNSLVGRELKPLGSSSAQEPLSSNEIVISTTSKTCMTADPLFCEIFKEIPELFFELIDQTEKNLSIYKFIAPEIKQRDFRLDGLLLTP